MIDQFVKGKSVCDGLGWNGTPSSVMIDKLLVKKYILLINNIQVFLT